MRMLRLACVLALLSLPGCPSPASSDAHTDGLTDGNDAAPDASPTDGSDASDVARPAYSCMPCLYDGECGPGGSCVALDTMQAPSYFTCVVACPAGANVGDPCDAAGVSATCQTNAVGVLQCTPQRSCRNSTRGDACPDTGCVGRYDVCAIVHAGDAPVCLPPCVRDAECENGFARCRPVTVSGSSVTTMACIPDDVVGPDNCGVRPENATGVGAGCDSSGRSCSSGLTCLVGIDPALPGFCTKSCTSDADCGGNGVQCLPTGTMGNRCVPRDCSCIAGARDALLDHALAGANWTRCDLFFTRANVDAFGPAVAHDRFRLPVFDRIHLDWLAGASYARGLGPALDMRASSLSTLIAAAAGLRQNGDPSSVIVGATSAAPAATSPLAEATALLIEAYGGTADRAALTTSATSVPMDLQQVAGAIVMAILRTARARDHGLLGISSPDDIDYLYIGAPHLAIPSNLTTFNPLFGLDVGAILGDVVLPVDEATGLAATIEAVDWSRFRGMTGVSFEADTPIGSIVIHDGATQMYSASSYPETALVLDLGGDDTYLAPVGANASSANSVSVLIDLAGNDTYTYAEHPVPLDAMGFLPSDGSPRNPTRGNNFSLSDVVRQGAGRLGVGLLYDLGQGADHYRTLRMGQGFGALGIGGLEDDGGNDVYQIEAGGQGSAVHGIGVALDLGGDDQYSTWTYSQGFAYVKGVGVLYDASGTDSYTSMLTPVAYGSAQDPTVNNSMSQGCGFGRRADTLPDHVNMSGGMGVLRDRIGNDHYTAPIFAQGTGYWGGMGFLLDGAGDDQYDARWYVQGGAAHFAYAALVDDGGVDVHNMSATRQNMTAGAGHDFSLGLLLVSGNDDDTYNVPNLALGAGNANGAGFFVDPGGNDTYNAASALTCGNAALESPIDPTRAMRPTFGCFLDGGGTDSYARAGVTTDPVTNDASWLQRIHADQPMEIGVGADGTSTNLGL